MVKNESILTDYKSNQEEYINETVFENRPQFFNNLIWMTTNEAAIYLRKSVNALRTAVCRGHIKARKFRRRLYFKRVELDKLIETTLI